jgi:hypothetical protein
VETQTTQSGDPANSQDETLDLLIRKYSSDADLKSAGHVQLIWLNPELLDALLDQYGKKGNKSPQSVELLKRRMRTRLDMVNSLAFLAIFRPGTDGHISQPIWAGDGNSTYPSVILRGSGNQLQTPYRWEQILGEGKSHWYSGVTWGYLLYKARTSDGHPIIAKDDFSFSVMLQDAAETPDGTMYDVSTEFHYDLMPVQLQSLVDSSIPSWNNSLVEMRRHVNAQQSESSNRYSPETSGNEVSRTLVSENSAMAISKSEVFQIIGLGIQFVELILK